MRLDYPGNIRIIRVPCTGKVDVMHLLRAMEKGADGLYVVGCLEGNCHYHEGNLRAKERVEFTKTLLEEVGLERERVRMYNLSAAEGPTFAKFAREMTEHIRSLGPNPIKQTSENRTSNRE